MAVRIYGNREIKTLPGEATRPTSSRVREALFNIWQGSISGCRWLDICAGSGAMGAEALCRGAAEAAGIEQSAAACRVITENWQKVAGPEQPIEVIQGDAVRQIKQLSQQIQSGTRPPFGRIYFDPPYASNLYGLVLAEILGCLSEQSEVAVEYSEKKWKPDLPTSLEIVKEKRYGSTQLLFVRRSNL